MINFNVQKLKLYPNQYFVKTLCKTLYCLYIYINYHYFSNFHLIIVILSPNKNIQKIIFFQNKK